MASLPRAPRAKQMDESMVAQMLNNPSAMKMVLNYLTKQNIKDHQNKWNKMSKTENKGKSKKKKNSKKKKPVTTKKPKRTTTTKKPKTKSPILQITQIKRRNDDGGKSKDKKEQQVWNIRLICEILGIFRCAILKKLDKLIDKIYSIMHFIILEEETKTQTSRWRFFRPC